MRDTLISELADLWENESVDAEPAARREILREHVDTLRMLLSMPKEIDTSLASNRAPTHRCKVCGAYWMEWSGSWSLVSRQCGQCCDNVAMGDQIEPLVISDIFSRSHPVEAEALEGIDPAIDLAARFGPILKAAFPKEHSVTRFQVANALASAVLASPWSRDKQLLDALRDESWDLRCFPVPTGGDDADIGWRVIGHWMAEPRERTVAEVYHDDPRDAIREALRARSGMLSAEKEVG